MADFGGFEIETPQEVQARLQQGQQQRLRSAGRDRVAIAEALFANSLQGVIANADAALAGRKVKQIAMAQKAAEKALPPTSSAAQRREAKLLAAQAIIGETDPAASLQIDNQLIGIEEEKAQQARLTAQDARRSEESTLRITNLKSQIEQRELDAELDNIANSTQSFSVGTPEDPFKTVSFNIIDPETGEVDPEAVAEMRKFQQENPEALGPMSPRDLNRATGKRKLDDAGINPSIGKTEARKLREQANGARRVANNAERMLTILTSNPNINSKAEGSIAAINSVANEFQSFTGAIRSGLTGEADAENRQRLSKGLSDAGIDVARWEGLTINLAYSIARSLEPGGRLSDADVANAVKMIGALNSDPNAVASVFKDLLEVSVDETVRDLELTQDSRFDGYIESIQASRAKVDERLENFFTPQEEEDEIATTRSRQVKAQQRVEAKIRAEVQDSETFKVGR